MQILIGGLLISLMVAAVTAAVSPPSRRLATGARAGGATLGVLTLLVLAALALITWEYDRMRAANHEPARELSTTVLPGTLPQPGHVDV